MNNKRILFVDTETGGLNPNKHSLLSIGLTVWENKRIVETKELFIKHETFNITPQAIAINKINLVELTNISSDPKVVLDEIIQFLNRNFGDDMPVTIAGHNINFDVSFIKVFFSNHNVDFNKYFCHRFIDTASILKYLYYSGTIEEDLSSSDKALKYFNIEVNKRHSALGDAIGTAELFSRLVELIEPKYETAKNPN